MADLELIFKICTKCKKPKSVNNFVVKSKAKDGRDPWCKECKKRIRENYYSKNREAISNRQKKFYQRDKEKKINRVKSYYESNKEICKVRMLKYYREHQESLPVQKCLCGCGDLTNPGRNFIRGHFNRGRKYSKEFCERMSLIKSNMSDETKRKMSESAKCKIISAETLQKLRDLAKERRGPKHPNWKGGISKLPYCFNWTDELKELVKERDNYQCQNPDCWGKSKTIVVHHINYNKLDCDLDNLITLCGSCNPRANKDRQKWQRLYKEIINNNKRIQSRG